MTPPPGERSGLRWSSSERRRASSRPPQPARLPGLRGSRRCSGLAAFAARSTKTRWSTSREPALLGRADVVPDVLGLAVLRQPGLAELAPEARLFVTAPLGLRHVRVVVVDPDRAHPQPARDPLALARVLRPDGAGQAVDAVVGDADGVVLVGEGLDGQHRAERLVLGHR